ncbi:hypothetical protein F5J12DRAFT_532232 [Pisolithus orientalis]|uniref:uncharacterized protein n=1 Tax=Pisolithus orientalis TaxID=936130 RepID=UPI0022257101|nr:uncharacterized protein F5J12DRAFT_532232 [Pisolithus orientalis]KAI5987988.1 hypothetical protein F5J12DRAFT_532232 [Pisolithus orientalis]
MRLLDIDPTDSAYFPVVSHVFSYWGPMSSLDDRAVAHHDEGAHLALHESKGLSLPINERFVLLLKALSTRAAGKHLVITVIQCNGFYRVDRNGFRASSALDSGIYSTEPRILTPLCTVASPQVWQREPPFIQRRRQFQSIREHFYALMHMHQSTGPGARHKSASRQKKDRAIKFFSDMFGLQPLRNYVGKITFFERLSGMMTTTAEGHGLLASLFMGSRQSRVAQDPRLEVVLPLLRERCQILCAEDDAPPRYADEKQKVDRELESISQTLSACLLDHIDTTFSDASFFHRLMPPGSRQPDPESRIEYDRQLDSRSMVQEIDVLQARLDEVRDDDEQRALEEDITGKILWFCWCGICAEVDQLLPQASHLSHFYFHIRHLTWFRL